MLKQKPYRNRKYLDWVKRQPCVMCHAPADDPHHIKRPGFGGSVKCADFMVIPMCRTCHESFHRMGWKTWESTNNVDQMEMVMRTLDRAFSEGVLDVTN